MRETWKKIKNWPYEISTKGRIRRLTAGRNTYAGRMMIPHMMSDGYFRVHLRDKGRERKAYLHVLVAEAFLPKRRSRRHRVAHQDGCRANCEARNLHWKTPVENYEDRLQHGTHLGGDLGPAAKLTWPQVLEIRATYARNMGRKIVRRGVLRELCARFGVSQGAIREIVTGISWKHPPKGRRAVGPVPA